MALQMRIYKEVSGVEAKVMLGMSWRQLLAAAVMLLVGGVEVFVFYLVFEQPDVGSYLLFMVCMPIALWGWWRPKGLKPERYALYLIRHQLNPSVVFRDGKQLTATKARPSINERGQETRTAGREGNYHAR